MENVQKVDTDWEALEKPPEVPGGAIMYEVITPTKAIGDFIRRVL